MKEIDETLEIIEAMGGPKGAASITRFDISTIRGWVKNGYVPERAAQVLRSLDPKRLAVPCDVCQVIGESSQGPDVGNCTTCAGTGQFQP